MKQPSTALTSPFERLDDSCVLQIMHHLNPKPDVFQLARTCQRFKRLAHDSRNWLVVYPTTRAAAGASSLVTSSGHGPVRFASFERAVEASRPGDTLLLLCGQHQLQGRVVIDKCLSIVAQGRIEDTLLCTSTKAEPALDVRTTCKITNVSISAHCAPCVMHRSGQLHLERCHLTCHAHGLDHLCAPVITSASSSSSSSTLQQPRADDSAPVQRSLHSAAGQLQHDAPQRSQDTNRLLVGGQHCVDLSKGATQPQDGHGRLTIAECLLEGGTRGVLCTGTGQLQGVRVIYQAHRALFYLEVDCRVPGALPASKPSLPAGHALSQHGIHRASSLVSKQAGSVEDKDAGSHTLTGVAALAQLGGLFTKAADARGQFDMHFTAVKMSHLPKQQKVEADSDVSDERSAKRTRC